MICSWWTPKVHLRDRHPTQPSPPTWCAPWGTECLAESRSWIYSTRGVSILCLLHSRSIRRGSWRIHDAPEYRLVLIEYHIDWVPIGIAWVPNECRMTRIEYQIPLSTRLVEYRFDWVPDDIGWVPNDIGWVPYWLSTGSVEYRSDWVPDDVGWVPNDIHWVPYWLSTGWVLYPITKYHIDWVPGESCTHSPYKAENPVNWD
jgi:hypothetical protein